jgi:hypothetical protein
VVVVTGPGVLEGSRAVAIAAKFRMAGCLLPPSPRPEPEQQCPTREPDWTGHPTFSLSSMSDRQDRARFSRSHCVTREAIIVSKLVHITVTPKPEKQMHAHGCTCLLWCQKLNTAGTGEFAILVRERANTDKLPRCTRYSCKCYEYSLLRPFIETSERPRQPA